jgi:ribosomal protein S27E
MPQATPNEWYISVVCEHCNHRVLLFPDLSNGTSELMRSRLHITCPECEEEGSYMFEHYQQPPSP